MNKFQFILFDDSEIEITAWVNISYLVSAIKSNTDIEVNVIRFRSDETDLAINYVTDNPTSMIGLPVFQANHYQCLDFSKSIKSNNSDIVIILGNVDATYYANHIMVNHSYIDYIIKGEGEYTLSELINCIISGKDVSVCDGIYYRNEGKVEETPDRVLEKDINKFSGPDRTYLKGLNTNQFSIASSRGCFGHCTFCDINTLYRRKNIPRIRDVDSVIKEVTALYYDFQCIAINFVDPVFFGGAKELIDNFYNKLRHLDLKISFRINMTCEIIDKEMVESLARLKEVGLDCVFLGLEAGNKEDLKLYGKKATLENNITATRLLMEHRILFMYGFININPYSDFSRLKENLNFFKENKIIVDLSIFSKNLWIFGGTPLLKLLKKDGLTTQDLHEPIIDVNNYNYKHDYVNDIISLTNEVWLYLDFKYRSIDDYLLYERYRRFIKSDNSILAAIIEFSDYMTKYQIELYSMILKHVERGNRSNGDYIFTLALEIKEETNSRRNALKPYLIKMTKALYRINQLVVK